MEKSIVFAFAFPAAAGGSRAAARFHVIPVPWLRMGLLRFFIWEPPAGPGPRLPVRRGGRLIHFGGNIQKQRMGGTVARRFFKGHVGFSAGGGSWLDSKRSLARR